MNRKIKITVKRMMASFLTIVMLFSMVITNGVPVRAEGIIMDNHRGLDGPARDLSQEKELAIQNINNQYGEFLKQLRVYGSYLTEDEKSIFTSEIVDGAASAKSIVNGATDSDIIAEAVSDYELVAAKTTGNMIITAETKKNHDAIDTLSNLTDTEKQTYKGRITEIFSEGKTAIGEATDTTGITSAKDIYNTEAGAVITEATNMNQFRMDKQTAISEITTDASEKQTAIDNLGKLTDPEKQTYKGQIVEAFNKGKIAIEEAIDASGITNAKDIYYAEAGAVATNAETLNKNRADAVTFINQKLTDQLSALNNNKGTLTDEEVKGYTDALNAAATQAITDVNSASMLPDIQAIVDNFILESDKQVTLEAIAADAKAKNSAIDAIPELSETVKATYKSQIAAIVYQANEAIIAANDSEGITAAKETYDAKAAAILAEAEGFNQAKIDAIKAIDTKIEEQMAVIKAYRDELTDEDLVIFENFLNELADEMKDKVANAIDGDAIAAAVAEFNLKSEVMVVSVIMAIDRRIIVRSIHEMQHLSDTDKERYDGRIYDVIVKAYDAYNAATEISEIEAAKAACDSETASIWAEAKALNTDKGNALQAIDAKFSEQLNALKANQGTLEDEDLETFEEALQFAASNAKSEIAEATNAEEIAAAVRDFDLSSEILVVSVAMADSIKVKGAAIDEMAYLSNENKVAYKGQLLVASMTAFESFYNATDLSEIASAKATFDSETAAILNAATIFNNTKKEGLETIDAKLVEYLAILKSNQGTLTDEELKHFEDRLRSGVETIKKLMEKATDEQGVEEAIAKYELGSEKTVALAICTENLKVKVETISDLEHLSDTDKGVYMKQLLDATQKLATGLSKAPDLETITKLKETFIAETAATLDAAVKADKTASVKDKLAIDKTNFPDDAFRAYVSANFDSDDSGTLSNEEIALILHVDVADQVDIKDLKGIEHFPELTTLDCLNTKITELNLENNTKLTYLRCGDTAISTLDLSAQTELEELYCFRTLITSLDLSHCSKLLGLSCFGTPLKTLDLGDNTVLTALYVNDTQMNGVDVSAFTIEELDCQDSPLAWLNLGTQNNIVGDYTNIPTSSTLTLEVPGVMFDIAEQYPGIDISKISNVKGANFDAEVGVFSNYKQTDPTITYNYDCGIVDGEAHIMTVTMKLTGVKGETILRITDSLAKTYDGKAVKSAPAVEKIGSTAAVVYTWEKQNSNKTWTIIDGAPKEVGKYRVTASVAEDENYYGASSAPLEFEITAIASGGGSPGSTYKPNLSLGSNPASSYKLTTTGAKGTSIKAPSTSDDSSSELWFALLALSAGIAVIVVSKKKFRKA